MNISTEARREEIINIIQEKGKVKVSELSQLYGISEVSIRKDLELLEAEGHLSRVHGGAVGLNKLYVNMDLNERYKTNAISKKKLAEFAVRFIEDNDTIMMNAGTTLTYVLRAIRNKKNITIVTNSVQNATEAALYPDFTVILLGGELDSKYQFTYGEDAIAQLENYHANKCILSVDGISASAGLTLYYSNEASLVKKMIESSGEVIITADSSKVGKNVFAKITDAKKTNVLVTTHTENKKELELLRKMGVEIHEA